MRKAWHLSDDFLNKRSSRFLGHRRGEYFCRFKYDMYYLKHVSFFHPRLWLTGFDRSTKLRQPWGVGKLFWRKKSLEFKPPDVSYQRKWYCLLPTKNLFIHVEIKDTDTDHRYTRNFWFLKFSRGWLDPIFLYPPESLTAHPWKYLPNRKVVFQPPFFRGELLNFQWGNPSGWDAVGGLYGKKSWQWTVFFKCEEKCRVYRHHPQKIAVIFEVWWTISILSTWYIRINI